jgi:hypothetical protein
MPDSTWIHSGTPETHSKTDLALAWIKSHREAVIGSLVMAAAAAACGKRPGKAFS